jgi:two-component system, OmpR family, alkaline phosphatase synthesis response regulator PhoP
VKTMNEPKAVLIIDDDSDFVRAIRALLEASGFKVRNAANGRDGLQLAKTSQPDLVLLDVMMSERTEGFFVLQEMRRIPDLNKTPVIVLSSIYSDEPTFRVDPDAGWLPANLFLAKPVDPARLLTEVKRLMNESALGKSSLEAGRR